MIVRPKKSVGRGALARIDLSNPLFEGLVAAWDFSPVGAGYELLSGEAPSLIGSLSYSGVRGGIGGAGRVLGSSGAASWSGGTRAKFTSQVTWFIVCDLPLTSSSFLLGDVQLTSTGYNHGLYISSSGWPVLFVNTSGSGGVSSGGSIVVGLRPQVIVGTWSAATGGSTIVGIYTDGVYHGTGATATGTLTTASYNYALNRWNGGSGQIGQALIGGVLNRAWSAAEVKSFGCCAADALKSFYGKQRLPPLGATPIVGGPIPTLSLGTVSNITATTVRMGLTLS